MTRASGMALGLLLAAGAALAADDALVAGAFSSARPGAALPAGWEPLVLARRVPQTRYTLAEDEGVTVLRAEARAAASGLMRRLHAAPGELPLLRWRWKTAGIVERGDLRHKAGDDYPARLYVVFDYPAEKMTLVERAALAATRLVYGADVPAAALCYVWDARAPVGTIAASPYTSRVRMIVVESGAARVNRWVAYERDIAADFRAAFGEEAPPVSGLALAVDTDNTGEMVVTWFGDISLARRTAGTAAARQPAPGLRSGAEPRGVDSPGNPAAAP